MTLRWTGCLLIALMLFALILWSLLAPWTLTAPAGQSREKRAQPVHDPLTWFTKAFNVSNSYELNTWYKYAQMLAKQTNHSNCYVCTRMPIAIRNPHIVPRPVTNVSVLFPHILPSAVSPSVLQQSYGATTAPTSGQNSTQFGLVPMANESDWSHFLRAKHTKDNPIYGPVHLTENMRFDCFYNNVTLGPDNSLRVNMGSVNPKYCNTTKMACLRNTTDYYAYNETSKPDHVTCVSFFTAPDVMGTYPQDNFVWLCGSHVFLSLPPGWIGTCAPIIAARHSFIVYVNTTYVHIRMRRSASADFKPHDPVWGSDVPNDHKLWTTGQKVMLSLFPQIGVGKALLRIETLDYRLGYFLNTTIQALKSVQEELTALRLMTLQNQLTASMGGVCAVVGSHCCTYIPANDEDHHEIASALTNLTKLRDAMDQDFKTDESLLSWLFTGPWWHVMLKVLTPFLTVIILVCLLFTCLVPCLRSMVSTMIQKSTARLYFHHYASLPTAPPIEDGETNI